MHMKAFFKRMAILPRGLKHKLLIAFCLTSVMPLLVSGYLVVGNVFFDIYPSPHFAEASIIILFCIIISWLGLFILRDIAERIIDLAVDSKRVTGGNYDRRASSFMTDEIGQISEAINFLGKKIKSNIADLKDYQYKMKEINTEIQKKISALSNLLQIGELIASAVHLDSILDLTIGKLSGLYENGFAALYFQSIQTGRFELRTSHNVEDHNMLPSSVEEGKGAFGNVILKKKHIVMDASSKFSKDDQGFKEIYKCENLIAFPILAGKRAKALLIVGNGIKNFTCTNDDIEMVRVFAAQISIAIENDILMRRAKDLEIRDDLTGLFNRAYITNCFDEEVKRSILSQRPCSFVLIDVDNFENYKMEKGSDRAELLLKIVARLIRKLSGPLEKAGRFERDIFAAVLPEKNKKEALEIAENIRKCIEGFDLSEETGDRVTASFGVSENPLDGADVNALLEKAKTALNRAKIEGKNRVIGAGV
ncbi:MAG: diguanylate cyclase [Candidatus Omnitrophota bacterium]